MAQNGTHRPCGWHSRGYLPHFDGGEIAQFVTFRLADALPKDLFERWENELATMPVAKANSERRKRMETHLDKGAGSAWMRSPKLAQVVDDALLHFDGSRYRLHAWVVMPNHVHVLITPLRSYSLSGVLHSWKSFMSKKANQILNRAGRFWQEEYFDRFIRTEKHFRSATEYIELNPVMAGLCKNKEDWKFSSANRRRD